MEFSTYSRVISCHIMSYHTLTGSLKSSQIRLCRRTLSALVSCLSYISRSILAGRTRSRLDQFILPCVRPAMIHSFLIHPYVEEISSR